VSAATSMTVSVLQREAAEAAKHEHDRAKAYELASSFATTPVVRMTFEEMAIDARLSSESWMRLANWLWLQKLLGIATLWFVVGCEVEPFTDFEPEPEVIDCEAETVPLDVEAIIPADAWLDDWRCPQQDPDPEAPFDGGCGYAYMTAVEQPDGQIWGVCERRLDCECLANWRACSTETPEDPWYCSCLIVHAGSIDDVLECEAAR
jgi:hypothetical protein